MRIARTTLVLLLANLVAFGLVWRATSAHRQTAASQDLLFPAALAKIELTESGQKLILEKRPSSWRITAPIEWPAKTNFGGEASSNLQQPKLRPLAVASPPMDSPHRAGSSARPPMPARRSK